MEDWYLKAECRDYDPELWAPKKGQSSRRAVSICRWCPVREECLEDALATKDWWHVIRGGLSPRRLREEARRRGLMEGKNRP